MKLKRLALLGMAAPVGVLVVIAAVATTTLDARLFALSVLGMGGYLAFVGIPAKILGFERWCDERPIFAGVVLALGGCAMIAALSQNSIASSMYDQITELCGSVPSTTFWDAATAASIPATPT